MGSLTTEKVFHKKEEFVMSSKKFMEFYKVFLATNGGSLAYSMQQMMRVLSIMSTKDRKDTDVTVNYMDEDILLLMFGATISANEDQNCFYSAIIPKRKVMKDSETI